MLNQSEHSSELPDGPMPFYRVLEEEYANLHSKAKGGDGASPIPPDISWEFSASQILEPRDLARRLNIVRASATDKNSDDVAAVVLGDDDALTNALALYDPVGKPLDESKTLDFANALTVRLNKLLADPHLRQARSIKALALSPYAAELRSENAATDSPAVREANRLFLEAAFPTQLERIRDIRLSNAFDKIRESKHSALCLSGGGIRSATFALGVVEALATRGVLTKFNYISTVSGGGFLGGWLSAWMKRAGPENAQRDLRKAPAAKLDPEPVPVKHLRTFTNYLSPKLGLLSADTWTLVATYIRNVLLNWLVIVPLIAMAAMIPWASIAVMSSTPSEWSVLGASIPVFGFERSVLVVIIYFVGLVAGAYSVRYVHSDEPDVRRESGRTVPTQGKTQNAFLLRCLLPLVISAILLTTALYLSWQWDFKAKGQTPDHPFLFFTGFGVLLHLLGWLWAWPFGRKHFIPDFLLIVTSGGAIGALSGVIALHLIENSAALYVTVAMPLFLLLLMLSGQLYLGVASRRSNDSDREWGARFNAWIFIVVVSWAAICAIIVYGPELFSAGYRALVGGSIGGLSGIITLMVGGSAKTSGKSDNSASGSAVSATKSLTQKLADIALGLAAPIFTVALVILISCFDLWAMNLTCKGVDFACRVNTPASIFDAAYQMYPLTGAALMIAFVGIGYFFGYFIDTNEFSLHAMYRMRLIRAYLGGSRPAGERRPDNFTGFDEKDDVLMRELWPAEGTVRQPLHVVNVTLNLVAGEKLAWQQRKAESFTMTPLHAGSAYLGYRRTSGLIDNSQLYHNGELSLGTAVAISGAAASPNMGYHSSSAITFLMTLFNARLGGWFGNPGPAGETSYNLKHSNMAVAPILSELFGLSDDRSKYVYLSDGGHFENIALYEMVLRRCRFIVVSDASCDEDFSFNDLGNAIRKIRIDLGVPIEFESPMPIVSRAVKATATNRAWAIARIKYSCVDEQQSTDKNTNNAANEENDGVLLYLKPAFYGDREPQDVYNYAKSAPSFPHESTADQFFSESQFESYRALGMHIANDMLSNEKVHEMFAAAGLT